jgi:hypothetical protein
MLQIRGLRLSSVGSEYGPHSFVMDFHNGPHLFSVGFCFFLLGFSIGHHLFLAGQQA